MFASDSTVGQGDWISRDQVELDLAMAIFVIPGLPLYTVPFKAFDDLIHKVSGSIGIPEEVNRFQWRRPYGVKVLVLLNSGIIKTVFKKEEFQFTGCFNLKSVIANSLDDLLELSSWAEVDGAAMAVAETPAQVVRILDYAINGRLAG